MVGFITDRDETNVTRLQALSAKGWKNMTTSERAEWSGDPLTASNMGYSDPVNLLSFEYLSTSVELAHRLTYIKATALEAGSNLYAVNIVGAADAFVNKTMTLSVDGVETSGGTPRLAVYWYDENGADAVGVTLSDAGSVTFSTGSNSNGRAYLALYIYVTTGTSVEAGVAVKYSGVMLEFGGTRHEYIPYTPILPTDATKGAYNYSDLNRVEMAVAELSDHWSLGLETKTDWGLWDIPAQGEMSRFVENFNSVKSAYEEEFSVKYILALSSMDFLGVDEANEIEKMLEHIYSKLEEQS